MVERRNWGEPSLSWWSEVWVKAWKVALLVSVSPTLWERVMSLCNIRQVTFNIDWKSRPVWSIWSRYYKYLQLRETEFKSDKECMVNALKHIMYGPWPNKEHVIYSMKRSWEKLLGGGGEKKLIEWSSYPSVSNWIHVCGMREKTTIIFQHVKASPCSVAQVICVGVEMLSQ